VPPLASTHVPQQVEPTTIVVKVGTSSLLRSDKNCIHLSQARIVLTQRSRRQRSQRSL